MMNGGATGTGTNPLAPAPEGVRTAADVVTPRSWWPSSPRA